MMKEIKGLSCFQIAHSQHCMGLCIGKGGQSSMTIQQWKAVKKQAYRVKISLPLYRTLMDTYGLTARPRNEKRRRRAGLDGNYHDREGNLSDDADKEFAQEEDDDEDDFEQEDEDEQGG